MAYPTIVQLRDWLQVPATLITDAQLEDVLASEITNQARVCRVPLDTEGAAAPATDQSQAMYRRVGRVLAAKGIPLGVLAPDSEYGPARLASYDAEIERLEGPTRVFVVGGPRRVMCAPLWGFGR
jgi:hypothetical protein